MTENEITENESDNMHEKEQPVEEVKRTRVEEKNDQVLEKEK